METKKTSQVLQFVRQLPDLVAGLAILAIIVLETMQCIARYFFRSTFLFVDDVVVICFSWAVFIGAAVAYRRKMHYGLEVITNRFGEKSKPYYLAFIQALTTALFAYLTYRSIVLYINSGSKILSTTRLSFKWVDAGAVIGFVLMTIYGIEFLVSDIRALAAKGKGGRT